MNKINKIFFTLITILLTFNFKNIYAYDSGVEGGSDTNPWTGNMKEGQGSIQNFDEYPAIRVTVVDKNGNKISKSIDYYTVEQTVTGKVYYKGYKFGTGGSHEKQKDNFFGLEVSDKYSDGVVFTKIKNSLEHKEQSEIIKFFEKLGLTESDIKKRIGDKNIFLVIEPIFMIDDGTQTVTGTSSELIKHLYDLKNKGTSLYNIHYAGTLDLMGRSLLMEKSDVDKIINKGFSKNIITTPAPSEETFSGWDQGKAYEIQSSKSGYGIVMYFVGDYIPCDPGECGGDDYTYICKSQSEICNEDTDVDLNGLISSYDSFGKSIPTATCVYNNQKYKFGQTDSYCTAKITSSTTTVLSKLSPATIGRFIGVTSNPSLTISWQCYSPNETERKTLEQTLPNYNMPNIKYKYLGNDYIYKNFSSNVLYTSETSKSTTPYGSNYYPLVIVVRYNYKYETQYLNKWVDKETGKGSGNSSTKPIDGHEYSVNSEDINFEVPLDEKLIGTNTATVSIDLLTSINDASNYFTKNTLNNGKIEKLISTSSGNIKITFKNSNNLLGNDTFNCPTTVKVKDNPNVPVNLVYRPIDLSNPFPGVSGEGRTSGINWTDFDIQTYITDRQDAYEKIPLYSVRLTPDAIKSIREYNKDNEYNDESTLTCDENGHYCLSTFLRDKNFSNIVDPDRSLCYNIDSTTEYDSCVIYSDRK